MRIPEPCLCGAPDCRRCFPGSWRQAKREIEMEDMTDEEREAYESGPDPDEMRERQRDDLE